MNAKPGLQDIKKLLETGGLAGLGPRPRPGVMSEAALEKELEPLLDRANASRTSSELIRSLLLLWHDHLDASHTISQGIDNTNGSFVHGIMHRREPDYGNAAYWFRRVGRHGAFIELEKRAAEFLDAKGDLALKKELMPSGAWNPFAFMVACESVAGKPDDAAQVRLLREIQRIETEVLLEWFLS